MKMMEAYDPGEAGSDRRISLLGVMLTCVGLLKHSEADNEGILERLNTEVFQHLAVYTEDRNQAKLQKALEGPRHMDDDTKQDSLVKRITGLVDSAVQCTSVWIVVTG